MNRRFTNMLLGGVMGSISHYLDQILSETWPEYPPELLQQLDPHLPTYGDLLFTSLPLVAWIPVKMARTPKPRLRDIALGVTMYSGPRLVQRFGRSMARAETIGFSHRAPSPYVTKAERLPFQTDIGY